jgi:hypothetical protein
MTTVAYTAFYDEVLPEVPGCLQAVALNAIRNAAIEFCQKTLAYIYNHPAISAVAATATYAFVPTSGTVVAKVLQAFYNGIEITPKTPDELKAIYASSDWRNETGTPLYYTQDDETNIRLVPFPSASLASALKMRVALKPTRASTTIEQRIHEEYLEAIKNGALYRLKISVGKPYSDPAGAAQCFAFFNTEIDNTKHKVATGFGRAKLRVRGQYF